MHTSIVSITFDRFRNFAISSIRLVNFTIYIIAIVTVPYCFAANKMVCPKCSAPVNCKDEIVVVCDGSCMKSYHAFCVGVSETIANCTLKNVLWLCDVCLDAFTDHFSRQLCSDTKAINFDVEIAGIHEKLTDITDTLSTLSSTVQVPQVSNQSVPQGNNSESSSPSRHSTPKLKHGCRIDGASSRDPSINHSSSGVHSFTMQKENTFSLFLSNIDSSVEENDVCNMVEQSLGINNTEQIDIVKLTPRRNFQNRLQYTSYKIVMEKSYKWKALNAHTWPIDIMFREFVEFPRRTWKPI